MKRRLASLLLCVVLVFPGAAYAADAMTEALSSIPADAMGFVCIPSLKQLDADYQQAINNLQLQMFLPPPANSLVALLKQKLPLLEGMDESRPLAVVFMPVESFDQLSNSQVILLSAHEPKAMIDAMQGQPGEGGLWTVSLMGQPAFAAVRKNQLIVAPTAELAKAVKDSSAGLGAKLKPEELGALEGLDIAVWMGGEQLSKIVKPMVDGFLVPIMMMQSAGGGFQAKSAEMNKRNIEMLVEGASSLGMGLSLANEGLGLRFLMTSRPGTEFANRLKVKRTTGTLLQGLPAGNYMLTIGQILDPVAATSSLKDLDPVFAMADDVKGIDKEKVSQLKALLGEWAPLSTGMRLVIEALEPGSDGLLGVSIIIDTTDSKKWLDHAGKAVGLGKEILASAAKGAAAAETPEGETPAEMDEDIKMLLEALTHHPAGEELGGIKVQHLKLDLAKIEDAEEEWLENIATIVGKDGLLFRMGAVASDKVVLSFGGGKDHMVRLIDQAKKSDAPLDNDAGIQKVGAHLPKERGSVGYLAVDHIVEFIKSVMKALDEEVIPVQMPPLDAPVAMTGTGGDGWMQGDVFIPTELMVAAKNAGMMLAGSMMAPPGATPPGETPPPSGE